MSDGLKYTVKENSILVERVVGTRVYLPDSTIKHITTVHSIPTILIGMPALDTEDTNFERDAEVLFDILHKCVPNGTMSFLKKKMAEKWG